MLRNYLRLSVKSIVNQGHQSIISAIGLSVALSCSIVILLYVQYEFNYDSYHDNADNIYRVIIKQPENSYMGNNLFAVTAGPLKEALVKEIPEIKRATKCTLRSHVLEYNNSLFTEGGFLYADTDFLKIFSFNVLSGDPVEALSRPFNLFITRDMALKYFGSEDPIGKSILADNKYVFTVCGLLENIPDNSHLDFDFITGFETYYSIRGGKENVEKWNSNSYITYFELLNNIKPESIKSKLDELYNKYTNSDNNPHPFKQEFIAEPLKDIHLGGKVNFEPGYSSDMRYIYLITSIGILIILIACFNYMNMATARSYSRGKEIGVLKVAGSSKHDLIIQFLIEAVLLTIGGLLLALFIVWFLLPLFADFTDRPLKFGMILEFMTLIKIIVIVLLSGLIAGLYPAIHLSSLSPLSLLKEDFKNSEKKQRSGNLRSVLIIFQYIISIVALISAFTVLRQLNFVRKTDLGFVKDNILTVSLKDPALRKNPEILINELNSNPIIAETTASNVLPVTISSNSSGEWQGKPLDFNRGFYKAGIDINFIDFYALEIVAGRGFSNDYPADSANNYILNETAARLIGWEDPIGQQFGLNNNMGSVIGVVKDFYYHSLRLKIEPLAISTVGNGEYNETSYISVKVNPGNLSEARQFVEEKLKELSPHYLNSVSFLSDRIEAMYSSDRQLASIFIFSTLLAFILTCLGLYGLSSYTTKSRTKEMVIRKVMGSQPKGIMALLAREMAIWILISVLFAWPTAYILMTKWLQNFSYHIDIGAAVFILSLIISLIISLIAISYHVIKLSKVNPAEMIRHD